MWKETLKKLGMKLYYLEVTGDFEEVSSELQNTLEKEVPQYFKTGIWILQKQLLPTGEDLVLVNNTLFFSKNKPHSLCGNKTMIPFEGSLFCYHCSAKVP
jgi:hypothetical protein